MGLLYNLVFQACTLHGLCQTVSIPIDCEQPPSMFECSLYGQLMQSAWCREHPGYLVTRYKCGVVEKSI